MKTQLPSKLRENKVYGGDYAKLMKTMVTVDQLIDVVAELTEVVEGNKELKAVQEYSVEHNKATLKEQLLGEVDTIEKFDIYAPEGIYPEGIYIDCVRKDRIIAIINKLLP